MRESETPSLLQKGKRRSAKSDVSNVLFPDIGKITNLRAHASSVYIFPKRPSETNSTLAPQEINIISRETEKRFARSKNISRKKKNIYREIKSISREIKKNSRETKNFTREIKNIPREIEKIFSRT